MGLNPLHGLPRLLLLFLFIFFSLASHAKDTANLKGVIFTVGSDNVKVLWPKARVSLRDVSKPYEMSTTSNDLGAYSFVEVPAVEYEVTVTLAGFQPSVKRVQPKKDETVTLDFQLILKQEKQVIDVTADAPAIDVTTSNSAPALTQNTLRSLVQMNQDFQDALPLLPGVTRGLEGELHIKGGRTNQTSTLVNTASVADPFTGQPAIRIPSIAVQSVQVLSNPFSAEYGKFSSGVVEVNTRGGTDQWKWLFEDPIPRFRWINGRTHGIESASPHLTFAGPLQRGKLYIFQSLLYGYDTVRVPSLPDPDNVRVQESATTYSQLDWYPKVNQQFTAVLTIDPQQTEFANINTFNPQPVTADYRQRGFFATATHRWIFSNGGFLQSLFAGKRFDSRVYPATPEVGEMTLFPDENSGTYFKRQERRTRLYQWSQTMNFWPAHASGRHLLKVGYNFSRSTYRGGISNSPVRVLRGDGTLTSTIQFGGPRGSSTDKSEFSFFVQDNWQISSRFALDAGVRFDHDSQSAEAVNVAPRIGFVFAPTSDNRTALRGGFGIFFDKIPINVVIFPDYPAQTVTSYSIDGTTVVDGPTTFVHTVATRDQRLRVPYSLGWTLQLDREVRRGLLLRLGYEHREGYRDFYVDPLRSAAANSQLQLRNDGRQMYREFLALVRWHPRERMIFNVSYVRSRAEGELNDYNQFFGNFPHALVRSNQYGLLPSDAPDRLLTWSVIPLPKKFDFIPILDLHTGFPHSKLDANWNYEGERNAAGRFPTFVGFDTKIQYPVDFTFRKHRIKFRAGLTVLNILGHFNPRDVQQYGPSPNYGQFYNSVGRQFRIDGDFDF